MPAKPKPTAREIPKASANKRGNMSPAEIKPLVMAARQAYDI